MKLSKSKEKTQGMSEKDKDSKNQEHREIIERTMEKMKQELKKPEVMAVFQRLKDK